MDVKIVVECDADACSSWTGSRLIDDYSVCVYICMTSSRHRRFAVLHTAHTHTRFVPSKHRPAERQLYGGMRVSASATIFAAPTYTITLVFPHTIVWVCYLTGWVTDWMVDSLSHWRHPKVYWQFALHRKSIRVNNYDSTLRINY